MVFVCHGPSCSERGSPQLMQQLRMMVEGSEARRTVRVCETSCLDNCATGPNVVVSDEGSIQTGVAPEKADALYRMLTGRSTE